MVEITLELYDAPPTPPLFVRGLQDLANFLIDEGIDPEAVTHALSLRRARIDQEDFQEAP